MPDWSQRRSRMLAMLVMLPAISLSYAAIGTLGWSRNATIHLDVAWDHAIPLVAPALAGYVSLGVFAVLIAWSGDATSFMRCLRAALVAMASAYLVFWLCPISVERGPLPPLQPWQWCYGILRSVDPPWNAFPSLHVAYAVLIWLAIPMRWWSTLWALGIIASTLLTHQHVLCDVAAGALLAAIAWLVAGASWYARVLPAKPAS